MPQNFIIFLCCENIDHKRKRSKVRPSDGHIRSADQAVMA